MGMERGQLGVCGSFGIVLGMRGLAGCPGCGKAGKAGNAVNAGIGFRWIFVP